MEQPVIPQITTKTLRPQIDSFIRKISADMWASILKGNADEAMQTMLAEFLVELITLIASIVFEAVQSRATVCEADIQSSLGDSLHDGFAEALEMKDDGSKCISSWQLTNLVVAEVAESIRSAFSSDSPLESFVVPRRLTLMVDRALEMLRTFAAKLSKSQPFKSKTMTKTMTQTKTTPSEKEVKVQIEDQEKSVKVKTKTPSPVKEVQDQETTIKVKTKTPSPVKEVQDQNKDHESKSITESIRQELNAVLKPFMKELPPPVLKDLQSASSMEILTVANEIAQLKAETELDARTSSPEPKRLRQKLRYIFTKTYFHGVMHSIMAQVRGKFELDSRAESKESIQSLEAQVDSLVLAEVTVNTEKVTTGDVSLVDSQRPSLPPGVKEMSDLLFYHIVSTSVKPHDNMMAGRTSDDLYNDLQARVVSFVETMDWWVNTAQADQHSDKVAAILMQLQAVSSETDKEPTPTDRQRMFFLITLEKLVARIFRKAGLSVPVHAPHIAKDLFTLMWTKYKDTEIVITPECIHSLDKTIYSDLLQIFGTADHVLNLLKLEKHFLYNYIATNFERHLIRPSPHGSAIRRFFSSLRKNISAMFRRSSV